ncbi:MAG: TenA family protein [Candidatus Xenobiia bacterium LiM19]
MMSRIHPDTPMDSGSMKPCFTLLSLLCPAVLIVALFIAGCGAADSGSCGYRGYHSETQNYTEKLWNKNDATYRAILALPFIRGVQDGTLAAGTFRDYIIQDYLYLLNYKKVFELLLSRAPDERARLFLAAEIQGIDQEIETVHLTYCKKYHITDEELANAAPDRATEAYNSFLTGTAIDAPFEVGLTAALPCCWIYWQVGTDLKNSSHVENNPYQEWIDAYGSTPWYQSDAREFVELVEYYMEGANDELRAKMEQAFTTAFGYEYMFWDR